MPTFARRLFITLLSAIIATAVGVTGTAEAAPAVVCGAVLKANATLTHDLSCPAGNGLTLYKGVTLNLGGHRITGPGTSGTAVTLSRKGGSILTNGTIANWSLGIDEFSDDYYSAPTSKISAVTFSKAPLNLSESILSVSSSTFTNSPIYGDRSTLTFSGSTFSKSNVDGFYSQIDIGSSKILGGDVGSNNDVIIDKSTMDGTGYAGGPSGCFQTGLTISNSTVKNYPYAIYGFDCIIRLTDNHFSNMPGGAIGNDGFYPGEVHTFVTGNTFTTSGIVLNTGAMVVSGNTFTRNATGLLAQDPEYTTVSGNTFSHNTSSGIRAVGNGLIVKKNTATYNGRYGIYAPKAVNHGGNVAYGNKSGQCVGLTCAGPPAGHRSH